VIEAAKAQHWHAAGLVASPITGPAGNHEYLVWLVDADQQKTELEARVAELTTQHEEKDKIITGISDKDKQIQDLTNEVQSKLAQIQNSNPNTNSNTKNYLQVLKENANRYTHSGRFINFIILKSIDRKVVDKNYALSYKDYMKISKK
jgi:hypothetical protein